MKIDEQKFSQWLLCKLPFTNHQVVADQLRQQINTYSVNTSTVPVGALSFSLPLSLPLSPLSPSRSPPSLPSSLPLALSPRTTSKEHVKTRNRRMNV